MPPSSPPDAEGPRTTVIPSSSSRHHRQRTAAAAAATTATIVATAPSSPDPNTRATQTQTTSSPEEEEEFFMMAHEAEILVPGAFVVLQGMSGDGMANTIDTMPILAYHGGEVGGGAEDALNEGDEWGDDDSSSVISRGNSDRVGTRETAAAVVARAAAARVAAVHTTSSNSTLSSSFTRDSGDSEEKGPSGFHYVKTTGEELEEEDLSAQDDDESGILFFDDSKSDERRKGTADDDSASDDGERKRGSSNGLPGGSEGNAPTPSMSAALRATQATEGGLHLPVPPTSTASCTLGYNSILPPIFPKPTGSARVVTAGTGEEVDIPTMANVTPRSGLERQRLVRGGAGMMGDSFIVVKDDDEEERHHIGDHNAQTGSREEVQMNNSIEQRKRPVHLTAAAAKKAPPTSPSGGGNSPLSGAGQLTLGVAEGTTEASSPQQQHSRRRMTRQERCAVRRWNAECREREARQRNEALVEMNRRPHPENRWWQWEGRLAVFPTLPRMTNRGVVRTVIGDLAPGCTVMGTEMLTVDSQTFDPVITPTVESILSATSGRVDIQNAQLPGEKGQLQFLKIESPQVGYVLYSIDGYSLLGPGLPSYYTEPDVWMWRVTCADGAYVREGLDLRSDHVDTIPHGSFLRVTRKTVNSMGLSRLRVEAVIHGDDEEEEEETNPALSGPSGPSSLSLDIGSSLGLRGNGGAASLGLRNDVNVVGRGERRRRLVEGWISESLNPLSGQRGPVAQPVPFPVPALYRVTLQEGAIIRSGVELSSPQIGHAPVGSILTVVTRAFSEHPMDQCIERLKLAGGGGWISLRLNRPPPRDYLLVEMVGIDGKFDPDEPGLYHLDAQKKVMDEYRDANPSTSGRTDNVVGVQPPMRRFSSVGAELSSINDTEEDEEGNGDSSSLSSSRRSSTVTGGGGGTTVGMIPAVPTLYRSGVARPGEGIVSGIPKSGRGKGKGEFNTEYCLICLTEERTATMVHGETGHIACCLACARILKARGDRCPVCRLPIDSVIQQFWA